MEHTWLNGDSEMVDRVMAKRTAATTCEQLVSWRTENSLEKMFCKGSIAGGDQI